MNIVKVTYNFDLAPAGNKEVAHIVEHEVDSPQARAKMDRFHNIVASVEQVDIPISHFFAKGLYARQGVIKKGTVIVGHIKKISHLNIISSGDISIFTAEGVKRITGQATMVAAPGTKRIGYAHEDTVWTTIVGTDKTDEDEIKDEVLAKTYEEYLDYCNQMKLVEEKQ